MGGWQKDMARRRYQKGSIRKRGKRNPVWELQWWEDYLKGDGTIGRRRQSKTLGLTADMTLRQAKKSAEEFLQPLNLGKVTPVSRLTLHQFVELYFIPNAFPTLKPSTRERYRRTFNVHLFPALGESRLCEISTLDLQRFVLQKMGAGLGWEVADHLRNLMSKVFAMAKKWGYYSSDNPASGVELPEKHPVREKHVLTPNQITKLLTVLQEPVRGMVLLGLSTGLRVGEILGLRRKDVDFFHKQIRVEQNYYRGNFGSPKTKGSRRTLPLPNLLVDPLNEVYRQAPRQSEDDLLFRTSKGTPYSDTNLLHRHLKPAGRKIGAPWLNWHTLRRTHATLLQHCGGSLKDAQAQLGHTKLSTTLEIYTLPVPDHQRQAVEKLAELVTNGDELRQFAKAGSGAIQEIQRIRW